MQGCGAQRGQAGLWGTGSPLAGHLKNGYTYNLMYSIRANSPPQIAYAESTGECRRALLMHHFGERSFGPEQCARTCDVCEQLAAGGKQVGVAQQGPCALCSSASTTCGNCAAVLQLCSCVCASLHASQNHGCRGSQPANYFHNPGAHKPGGQDRRDRGGGRPDSPHRRHRRAPAAAAGGMPANKGWAATYILELFRGAVSSRNRIQVTGVLLPVNSASW